MKYDCTTPHREGLLKDRVIGAGCDNDNGAYIKAHGVGYRQTYQPLPANRTNELWQSWRAQLERYCPVKANRQAVQQAPMDLIASSTAAPAPTPQRQVQAGQVLASKPLSSLPLSNTYGKLRKEANVISSSLTTTTSWATTSWATHFATLSWISNNWWTSCVHCSCSMGQAHPRVPSVRFHPSVATSESGCRRSLK